VIEQLETSELYELEAPIKLQILVGLCHRIMASYSVQDFMDEKNNEAAQLWSVSASTPVLLMYIYRVAQNKIPQHQQTYDFSTTSCPIAQTRSF